MAALAADLEVSTERSRAAMTERTQHLLLLPRQALLLLQLGAVRTDDLSDLEARSATWADALRMLCRHAGSAESVVAHAHQDVQRIGQAPTASVREMHVAHCGADAAVSQLQL